ncbi:DUF2637 domain-containing protein [Kitasatospora sp. NPDC059648]|uniref:DUF2637 domain-containing protein n=1 Tax=Kitasatospora sp. NPDC059648 TaxID=3346894 RepID=UPI0036C56164
MNNPIVQNVLLVVVALACLGLAAALGIRVARYVLEQWRAMRPAGADTVAAGKARVNARGKIMNLAFLFAFAAVPASLSYAHLIGYAQTALGLHGGMEYLVPLALDEAAMYLMMLSFQDVDREESAAGNRLLVWVFALASAWFNWIQAPRGAEHHGAPEFFAGVSIAAGVLFERGLVSVRRAANKASGHTRRPLPKVGVLRWLSAPVETAAMMRMAIEEPTISTEAEALAAVRTRRAIRRQERTANRTAKATAKADTPAGWWQVRRVVVTTAEPTLTVDGHTPVPATAVAAVLAPYVQAKMADRQRNTTGPQLALGHVLHTAAHQETRTAETVEAELTALEKRAELVEAQADEAEDAVVDRFMAQLAGPIPAPRTQAEPAEPATVAHETDTEAHEVPVVAEDEAAECIETTDENEVDEEPAPPARKAAAAQRGDTTGPRVSARVPKVHGDDADGHDTVSEIAARATKRKQFAELFAEYIRPGDTRSNNAIVTQLNAVMTDRYGYTYDRSPAGKLVKVLRKELDSGTGQQGPDEDTDPQQRGA